MNLFLSLLLLAASPSAPTFPPADVCAADPSFVAFREELWAAIGARDAERLLLLVSDDIEVNFGGDSGRADFARNWRLERGAESPVWETLHAALALGCAQDRGAFVSPSIFAQIPEDADPFETFLALDGAMLHRRPSEGPGEAIDWQLARRVADQGEEWMRVTLRDGREGFVRRAHLRSVIDYRAHFEKRDGRWLMTSLLAGD